MPRRYVREPRLVGALARSEQVPLGAYHRLVARTRQSPAASRAAAAGVVLGLAGGVVGCAPPGPTSESPPGIWASIASGEGLPGQDSGGDPSTRAARRAAAELLAARGVALAARDRGGWLATVADPGSDDGRRQGTAYDNLVALGVRQLTISAIRDVPVASSSATAAGPGSGASWTGVVEMAWAIPGYDAGRRTTTRTIRLLDKGAGWRVASDGGPTDQLQVWDLGALHVERSTSTLVAGDVDPAILRERLADAAAAQGRLGRLVGAPAAAVIVVPADPAAAARQLGRPDAASLSNLAAATDGALGPDQRSVADRVVLNPVAFSALTDEGRRVVVAHELTHVAVRASVPGEVPTWLSEGLAEYVALQGVSLPDPVVAARLLDQVRVGGPPATLPTSADFEPALLQVATAYQQAWLAVRAIATRYGEPTLMAFYRRAAGSPGGGGGTPDTRAAAAMVDLLHTTPDAFVEAWRSQLRALAAA